MSIINDALDKARVEKGLKPSATGLPDVPGVIGAGKPRPEAAPPPLPAGKKRSNVVSALAIGILAVGALVLVGGGVFLVNLVLKAKSDLGSGLDVIKSRRIAAPAEPKHAESPPATRPAAVDKTPARKASGEREGKKAVSLPVARKEFVLHGIAFDENEPMAVINGGLVGEGDYVSDAKVEEILVDRVILSRKGERIVLTIE